MATPPGCMNASGLVRVGEIPDYALMSGDGLCATTYYYRQLR